MLRSWLNRDCETVAPFMSEALFGHRVGWMRHLDLVLSLGRPRRCGSPAADPVIGCAFDVQILQVGHKLVYNGPVLVHVKINILFCVPG